MTDLSISYGTVLYELGISEEVIETAEKIFTDVPEISAVLENPTLDRKVKNNIIERVFPKEIQNYLKQMSDYQHSACAREAFEAYHSVMDKQKGCLDAVLYYVTKPQEAQEKGFKDFLCGKYACKDVNLSMVEVPELIGGFILKVGNSEYDWSIRGRMQQLKTNMIRR